MMKTISALDSQLNSKKFVALSQKELANLTITVVGDLKNALDCLRRMIVTALI